MAGYPSISAFPYIVLFRFRFSAFKRPKVKLLLMCYKIFSATSCLRFDIANLRQWYAHGPLQCISLTKLGRGQSSFVPLNVEIESESEEEVDDSKEIQVSHSQTRWKTSC